MFLLENTLLLSLSVAIICLIAGSVLGYYVRQSIVKKRKGTIEARLQKKIAQVKQESEEITAQAKTKAGQIVTQAQQESDERRKELLQSERMLFKREHQLDEKSSVFEKKERDFEEKVKKLKQVKDRLDSMHKEATDKLEAMAGLSREEAKKELLNNVEKEYGQDILLRMKKVKQEGEEKYSHQVKEIMATAMQRYAISQAQDITTTTIALPSEEAKGRIIGKEGRNIKTFEKITGVDVLVDETPESVVISGFNPIRRQIAKVALERLIKDGRIQPARIEEQVKRAEDEIVQQIKEAGEKAVFEAGIVDLPPKLIELLGRLYFRTSYGQNVLMHSLEVAYLSSVLAEELGANPKIAKKAGLLHDIGKAVDHQVQGSHTDIGIKILEKFGQEKDIISAMKSHHEDYEPENLEAVLVKVADQVSGARPGARKDTVENYLRRLQELEEAATGFPGVNSAYAIQAGREVRVFVKPEEIGDLEAYKLARDVAGKIQEELNYPGEIKITVIRETRVVEYAK
ncbi:MAG: ribonuclease Y [Patescibacteria group bacterium]|nr:ribonuclease Y [Patescibacteria group bacterium]